MAQQVSAQVYGMNNNLWGAPQNMSFPTQGVRMFEPPAGTVSFYGIYLYGAIKALLEDGQPEYLTTKSYVVLAIESNL